MSCVRFILFTLVFLLAACSPPRPSATAKLSPVAGQALLTAYLSTSGSALSRASFTIEQVELYHHDAWVGLDLPPAEVDNKTQRKNQLLLGVALAPAGEYRRLRFQLKNLTIDGLAVLPEGQVETVELLLPDPLSLKSKESQCLFLNWALQSEHEQRDAFTPLFTAWGQRLQLGAGLAYVACRDIDTIYILRTDTNDLVASFAVPGPIGEIQIDQRLRRLYVMSPGSRSVFVYDCLKARLLEQIFLPRTVAPEHFAVDLTSRMAYVTDSASGQVFKVDLATGTVLAEQRVGHRPEKIALARDGKRLAVVAPKAQQVSILSADSLDQLRTFAVGQQVTDLLFLDEQLYIVEQSSNSVASYEYRTGRLSARIPVGFKPTELLAVNDQLFYVSNQASASLSALIPGQKTSFRRIPVGAAPDELGISRRYQVIYVLSSKSRTLSVVDLPAESLKKTISLGGPPKAIAVLD